MFSQVLRPLGSTWRMRQVKIRKKLKIDPPYCTYCAAHSYWSELHGSFKGASLFFKERQERFAHGHSFLKRDESDSIQKSDSEQFATLAHYKNWQWAIRLPCSLKRSNRSDWLFFMSESFFRSKKRVIRSKNEWFAQKNEWFAQKTKARIPNPGFVRRTFCLCTNLSLLSWASEMGTVMLNTVHRTDSSQVGVVSDPCSIRALGLSR